MRKREFEKKKFGETEKKFEVWGNEKNTNAMDEKKITEDGYLKGSELRVEKLVGIVSKKIFEAKVGLEEQKCLEDLCAEIYEQGLRTGCSFGLALGSGGGAPPSNTKNSAYFRIKLQEFKLKYFPHD